MMVLLPTFSMELIKIMTKKSKRYRENYDGDSSDCPSRTLRSLDTSLLTVPRFSLETFGERSFSVFGPTVWNSLPLSLRKTQCFTTFKRKLKTHLFHIHLC